jgi:hypothetical protein
VALGRYRVTRDTAPSDTPHEVAVIKGRRFRIADAARALRLGWSMAKHVNEVDQLAGPVS